MDYCVILPKPHGCDLFADFNGLPDQGVVTEFYQHDQNWRVDLRADWG